MYYYQLKENFLNINHSISQERYFELAALALQADYGNFNHEIHKGSYFDIDKYFPKWVYYLIALISNQFKLFFF